MANEFIARNGITSLGNIVVSGSITTTGTVAISGSIASASFSATASSADNFLTRGTLTAQTLVVQTITSSIDFVTGSTRFGSTLANSHVFSGSVTMNPGGLFVSSSGNVGIGTSSPSSAANYRYLTIMGSSTTNGGVVDLRTAGSIIWRTTSDNTERMRITSGGNVGINGTPSSFSTNVYFDVIGNSTSQGGIIQSRNSDNSIIGSFFTNTNGLNVRTETSHPILFSTAATERMRIASNGIVLVNATSPGSFTNKFIVNDAALATGSNGGWFFLDRGNSANQFGWYSTNNTAHLWNGSANIMSANSSGYITKPYNPAFRAYSTTNGYVNLNVGDVFPFNATEYNIGSGYNTSNYRFTAPVAGVYKFDFYSILYGAYTNAAIAFHLNAGNPTSGFNLHFSPNLSGAWSNVVYTTSLYLNSGDYVFIKNTGTYVQYHGLSWSSFSGYLVG